MIPQWHLKDPSHSAKSAGGRLHLNTYLHLTQQSRNGLTMLLRHIVGICHGNELTCYSSGNTQLQSSQFAEPRWTGPSPKSGIGVRKLISMSKQQQQQKKRR